MASDLNTYGLNMKKLPSSFAGRPLSSSSNNGIPLGSIMPWFLPNTAILAHGDSGEFAPEDPRTFRKEKAVVDPSPVSHRLGNSLWDKNVLRPKSIWDERSFESRAYNSTDLPRHLINSSNHGPHTFDQESGFPDSLDTQCSNLACFGSFEANPAPKISEKKDAILQCKRVMPDVMLSLSLPNSRELEDVKQSFDSTGLEMTNSLGSSTLGSLGRPNSGQLTIFYAGNVNVYDDVPLDKAKAIMLWAARESENPSNFPLLHPITANKGSISPLPTPVPCQLSTLPPPILQSPVLPCELNQHRESLKLNNLLPTCPTAHKGEKVLPQARKASLARFLEKRRERVLSKVPYAKKISPLQDTFSQGDTELSTNCRPTCSSRRRVSDEYSDEKMSHTSKQVEFRMDMEYSAEHELPPTTYMYETED